MYIHIFMFWKKKTPETPDILERMQIIERKQARILAELADLYAANEIITKKLLFRMKRAAKFEEKQEEEEEIPIPKGIIPSQSKDFNMKVF